MKKVYVRPESIVQCVELFHYLNKVSATKSTSGDNLQKSDFNKIFQSIDVNNDKPDDDDIWKNL